MPPEINIAEVQPGGIYTDGCIQETVKTTKLNLPDESGTYDTPLGRVSLDLSRIGPDQTKQILGIESNLVEGKLEVPVSTVDSRGKVKIADNKTVTVYCRKAREPYRPPHYGNPI